MRRDVQPDVANQNHPSFEILLMEKLTAIAGELADDGRRADLTFVEVEQIDAPLARVRIVKSQGLRLDVKVLRRVVNVELLKIGIAVQKFFVVRYSVIKRPRCPSRLAGQGAAEHAPSSFRSGSQSHAHRRVPS